MSDKYYVDPHPPGTYRRNCICGITRGDVVKVYLTDYELYEHRTHGLLMGEEIKCMIRWEQNMEFGVGALQKWKEEQEKYYGYYKKD